MGQVGDRDRHRSTGSCSTWQDPDNLVIETPIASLGIRGTQFFAQVDPVAEIVEIALMHGSLAVTPSATGLESVHGGSIALPGLSMRRRRPPESTSAP